MYPRHILPHLEALRHESPVLLLLGARQTGKTTLLRQIADRVPGAAYISFDDSASAAAAHADPAGFLRALDAAPLVLLDEVQRVLPLFLPLKQIVDEVRFAGRHAEIAGKWCLTGSANILLLPQLADTLAGRMTPLTLSPLTQAEIENRAESPLPALLFGDMPAPHTTAPAYDLWERVVRGGFPEAVRLAPDARSRWLRAYADSTLQRDVRDLAQIDAIRTLPRLLTLLAQRTGGLLNQADLARDADLSHTTLSRYATLLRTLFFYAEIPAWGLTGLRLMKSPKVCVEDTGLALALLQADAARLQTDPLLRGRMLETFVLNEIRHALAATMPDAALRHFRTPDGQEIDGIVQRGDGTLTAFEVKASASVTGGDVRALNALRDRIGERFVRGLLFYTGTQTLPFGERIWAVPIPRLWQ